MKRVRDKEETAVADDCLVLSITFDLLVHILSYACPGAYQALALTCKVFCDCTKKPAFWNRAIRLTTQARLDACGVIRSEIPPLLYQDLDSLAIQTTTRSARTYNKASRTRARGI